MRGPCVFGQLVTTSRGQADCQSIFPELSMLVPTLSIPQTLSLIFLSLTFSAARWLRCLRTCWAAGPVDQQETWLGGSEHRLTGRFLDWLHRNSTSLLLSSTQHVCSQKRNRCMSTWHCLLRRVTETTTLAFRTACVYWSSAWDLLLSGYILQLN